MPIYASCVPAAIKEIDSSAALFPQAYGGDQYGGPSTGYRLVTPDIATVESRPAYRPHLTGGQQAYGKMVETLPMACMQQFFAPFHTPIRQAGCKGDSHTQATVMSPNHEREIELSELMNEAAGYQGEADVNRYSVNGYGNQYDNNGGYDVPSYYTNGQDVPATQIDCTKITALNKPLMGATMDHSSWRGRHPNTWSPDQVTDWVYGVCKSQNIDFELVRHSLGDLSGATLVQLRKDEFDHRFNFVGHIIFESLEMELRVFGDSSSMYQYSSQIEQPSYWNDPMDMNGGGIISNNLNGADSINMMSNGGEGNVGVAINSRLEPVHHDQQQQQHNSSNQPSYASYVLPGNNHDTTSGCPDHIKSEIDSDVDSNQSSNQSFIYRSNIYTQNTPLAIHDSTKVGRRKPGRPPSKDKKSKNKNGQRNSRLWEFIRDLLLNPETCPSLLKWENVDEGIFRFVQSDKVARLWGQRKCNPRMTYEKLSRAMRYYYKSQVFQPVIGRRLVYKFGPTATGWKPHPSLVC